MIEDEIIAAYIRERKPEVLDTLSFIMFSFTYKARRAIQSLTDAFNSMDLDEISATMSEFSETESEGDDDND